MPKRKELDGWARFQLTPAYELAGVLVCAMFCLLLGTALGFAKYWFGIPMGGLAIVAIWILGLASIAVPAKFKPYTRRETVIEQVMEKHG